MTAELVDRALALEPTRQVPVTTSVTAGEVVALRPKRPALPAGGTYTSVVPYQVHGALALKPSPPCLAERLTPDATRTAVIVARALLEVLSGWRPAGQLSRWTTYALQQDLERRAPRRPNGARLQLRGIRVSEPATGIAEVCALADDPGQQRIRVIALRLEARQGGWIVTRLEAG
jgi:hypothetical protein